MLRFSLARRGEARRRKLAAIGLALLAFVLWRMAAAPARSPLGFLARARNAVAAVDQLRRVLGELEARSMLLNEEAHERVRLAGLLAQRQALESAGLRVVPARVIAEQARGTERTIVINRGRRHRVRRHDVLVCAAGLVGLVVEPGLLSSRAILLTDERAGVPVRVQPPSEEAARGTHYGIACGGRGDGLLWLTYLTPDANVAAEDEVWTSGRGEVYPPDIRVGWVTGSVILEPPPPRATVVPAVRWGKLREVLVVHRGKGGLSGQ